MSEDPKPAMNLDPEMLAAYIDKRLTPEQRAAVEAQLASDPDSYAVLVESMKALDALEGEQRTVPFAAKKKPSLRRWTIAAGVLAVAAALILVVMQPQWLSRLRGGSADADVQRLVSAVGPERYLEARLTGGFQFGPLKSETRGASDLAQQNLALLAAAGDLQKRVQADPSANNLHAFGVARLLMRDADGAIDTLESAVLAQPQSAVFLSDLAAAYLTRYQWTANPQDLPRALDTIERARNAGPVPIETLFTRALALELMHLDDMAIAAWREYLAQDSTSDWASEAKRRLDRLTAANPVSRFEALQQRFLAANDDGAAEVQLLEEFPEEVPDLILGKLVPAWAAAVKAGDSQAAVALAARAERITAAMAQRSGDPGLHQISQQLATSLPQVDLLAALGQGIQHLEADQYAAADPLLTSAYSGFSKNSVLRSWAAVHLARVEMFLGRPDHALALLDEAGAAEQPVAHRQLVARAVWMRGIIRFTRGMHEAARREYEQTIALHAEAHEPRAAALALMNLSVVYRFRGDRDRSWQYRLAGLAAMPRHRPSRYYGFLTSTAISASLDDWPYAAVAVIDEAVRAADEIAPNLMAESRLQRARLMARIDRSAEAQADIEAAGGYVESITDKVSRTRTEASLKIAKAEVLQAADPRQAAEMAREASAAFQSRADGLRSAELALYESRALSNLGDQSGAITALDSGIAAFETMRAEIPTDDPARISALEPAWALFDEDFVRRIQDANFDRASAFRAFEISRARTLVEARMVTPVSWDQARDALSSTQALLLLHQRDNELVVWWITKGSDRLFRLPWSRAESARLASLCKREVINAGPSPTSVLVRAQMLDGLENWLASGSTIIVVPDGNFHQMPWAGLRDRSGSPAVRRWAFAVAPSVSLALRRRATPHAAAAVIVGVSNPSGMPALPAVAQEVRDVAAIYPDARVLLDGAATPAALLQSLPGAGVIHIAAHAIDSPSYPMLSRLVLSGRDEDGALTTAQVVRDAHANGAIVVLAACNSIGAASRRGEGTVGLAWAFLMADAAAVVGSLWDLDDADGAALFADFHSNLRRGLMPAEALRASQLAAVDRGARGDWAAVQVVGHP
jgi:predicted negative regulator of RcsB-dependent stress response